jgi:hypothetical protein
MYQIQCLHWNRTMTYQGNCPDERTALIAARVLSLRDINRVVYVSNGGLPVACYGDAPKRPERRRFHYSREKRELLRGDIGAIATERFWVDRKVRKLQLSRISNW